MDNSILTVVNWHWMLFGKIFLEYFYTGVTKCIVKRSSLVLGMVFLSGMGFLLCWGKDSGDCSEILCNL